MSACADCQLPAPIMVVLRAPTGPWELCSTCYRESLRRAEADRKDIEQKFALAETHNRERVGSH